MSTEDNKAIAGRFVQAWGKKGGANIVDELAAPDISVAYPVLPQPIHGREAFKELLHQVYAGLPDGETTVDEVIAEGDKVVVRWTARGTHQGELMGVPPTGRHLAWTGITIYRLAGGKVVEELGVGDSLGMFQQLGVIPGPGQGGQ
ncbi:MAG: ester cyclase [Chloroflexi bacterium]|nr:ester cyclase [Chloroflexota bacterium]